MPTAIAVIASIVTVAAGVAQVVAAKKQEKALKESAARQQVIETEKLEITQEKREIDTSREEAKIRRETRRKQAVIASRALGSGIRGSSIVRSGTQAIASGTKRELDFISQTSALADRADVITQQQIALDAATARRGATTTGLSGTIAGATTIAKGAAGLNTSGLTDIFSGSEKV